MSVNLDFDQSSGNPIDTSPSGRSITRNSAATEWAASGCYRGAGCLKFLLHGANPVEIESYSFSQTYSFVAWVKTSNLAHQQTVYFNGVTYNSNYVTFGQVRYNLQDLNIVGTGLSAAGQRITAPVNAWAMLAVTRSTTGLSVVYWNGAEVTRSSSSTSLQGGAGPDTFILGAIPPSLESSHFEGWMDDVTIWERALSAGEVQVLYEDQAAV